MKKIIFLYSIFLVIMSCSNNEEGDILTDPNSFTRITMTYSEDTSDVSVLIFGKENNEFIYQRALTSGWVDNKISTNLELGQYKFLFVKAPALATTFSTVEGKKLEEITINAKMDTDPQRSGYVLPVEEIWMPETAKLADSIYTIMDQEYIPNKLVRSVSQVEVYIKRGEANGDDFDAIEYVNGNIMDDIKGIQLHVNNVGEYIDYRGSHGSSSTYYSTQAATEISDEGFAYFKGPFVFPTESTGESATVDVVVKGKRNYPAEMKTSVTSKLERNKKMIITLWLSPAPTIGLIDITVDTSEITATEEGDKGIWE